MVSASRKEILTGFMNMAKKVVTGLNSGTNQGFNSAVGLTWAWISFEAFACGEYHQDAVQKRINMFVAEFKDDFRQNYSSLPDELKKSLIGLQSYRVTDQRPSHLNDLPIEITDIKELGQVMALIYQIRNNLMHGGKNMEDKDDMTLVRYSSKVLYYLMERVLINKGIIS